MDLSKILSISGKPGLFTVISQLKNAVLVESITDKKRYPAFAHEKISSLKEISVFTTGEDKPLKEVLKTMFEKFEGKPAIDTRVDDKTLKSFFLDVVPDYDSERVYISDIKKIISWYNLLAENKLLDFTEPEENSADESAEAESTGKENVVEPAVRKKKANVTAGIREKPANLAPQRKTRKKV